jgi:gluconolactonase
MRPWLTCLLLTIAPSIMAAEPAATSPVQPVRLPEAAKFHIYLLMGQSNMAGRGKVEPADQNRDPRILSFDKSGHWVVATDPLHWDKPAIAGVGPGMGFAREMVKLRPDVTIGLVPCAVGGTPLEVWEKDARQHVGALGRARQAAQYGTLKGILWHQGESDANPHSASTYRQRLTATIAAFRSELAAPDLPFVVGSLGDFIVAGNPLAGQINEALQSVSKNTVRVGFASAAGLGHKGDKVHFDTAAQRELGARYARAMIDVQGAPAADSAAPAESSIVAPGAKLEKRTGDCKFTEGPAADAQGNVFFTDQPNDRILKWSVDGKLSTFLQPCGRSNGLCFDGQGNLWACADEHNQLWSIDPAGKVTVLVKDYQGKLLNGPNDVWLRPDGGAYFTDPYYKRAYWKRGPKEIDRECVYYLTPDHRTLTCVVDDLKQPNGIIGTPDGKTLYVADIGGKKSYAYDIRADGRLANKKLFCELGSDGMTIDSEGNVYLTGKGVTVFDKTGRQIEHIAVEEPWTGNVCFGGADRHTLFITASKCLYTLRMRVTGVGSQ